MTSSPSPWVLKPIMAILGVCEASAAFSVIITGGWCVIVVSVSFSLSFTPLSFSVCFSLTLSLFSCLCVFVYMSSVWSFLSLFIFLSLYLSFSFSLPRILALEILLHEKLFSYIVGSLFKGQCTLTYISLFIRVRILYRENAREENIPACSVVFIFDGISLCAHME